MTIHLRPGTYNPSRFVPDTPFAKKEAKEGEFNGLDADLEIKFESKSLTDTLVLIEDTAKEFWLKFGSRYLKTTCGQDLLRPYVKIDTQKEEVQILTEQGMFDGDKRPVFGFKISESK